MSKHDRRREELVEAGVIDVFNDFERESQHQLTEEVEHSIYPPIHEGKSPTYGCVLLDAEPARPDAYIGVGDLAFAHARQLANGRTSFALRHDSEIPWIECFATPHDDEASLIELRERWRGTIVHRGSDERVRVLNRRGIFTFSKGSWRQSPYSHAVVSKVRSSVPQCDEQILSGLLEFAFHSLSPSRTGATLVWWIQHVPSDLPKPTLELTGVKVNAASKGHKGALEGLLRQHDGAVFLRPNAELISIGAHLRYSEDASKLVADSGGTRHTSAKRYTFDEPSVVAIVVSEDGPVSIFSDGAKIAELHEEAVGSTERLLSDLVPEKAKDVETDVFEKQCPQCGKYVSVEVVTVYGMREPGTGRCPVCREVVHGDNCHLIFTRIRKRL